MAVYLTRFGHKLGIKFTLNGAYAWIPTTNHNHIRTSHFFRILYHDDAYILTIICTKLLSCIWNKAEPFKIFYIWIQCADAVSSRLIMRREQNRAHRKREWRQNWKPQTKQNARNLFLPYFPFWTWLLLLTSSHSN